MLENENGIESDVSTEPSSEVQETSQEQSAESQETAKTEQQPSENVPFHKHPRWIERDNELKAEREARTQLERRYAEMESRIKELSTPKPQTQEDLLIKDLKEIRPEFGERFEKLWTKLSSVEKMEQELQGMRQQQFMNQAVSTVSKLHADNKVSPELQELYNEQLDSRYRAGQLKSVDDVAKAYKEVHDRYSKFLDSVRRSEREAYSSSKKQDAAVPTSQPKGKAVPTAKGFEFSKDPGEAKAQLVRRIMETSKTEKDI